MKKPVIGIVSRPGKIFDKIDILGVEETNRKMILKFGGVPIMILPPQQLSYDSIKPKDIPGLCHEDKVLLMREIGLCDGILMPGGLKSYSYDYFIDDYSKEIGIPVLGECLGMQIMARNHGCAIVLKNNTNINHNNKDTLTVHDVIFVDDTKISDIVGEHKTTVNSTHSYHVSNVKKMIVGAYAEDGIVEALEDPVKLFRIGVQWHPEKDLDNECNQRICESFINAAKTYKMR